MDLGSFRRADRVLADRGDARLDYDMLVATLEALQSASAGARAALRDADRAPRPASGRDPLVELLTAGPEWRAAIPRQAGCFHRASTGGPATGRQPR